MRAAGQQRTRATSAPRAVDRASKEGENLVLEVAATGDKDPQGFWGLINRPGT